MTLAAYIHAIKNRVKQTYAWAYYDYMRGVTARRPTPPPGLSTMAAQCVRLCLEDIARKEAL